MLTTVYMQACQKNNLIGIQYWWYFWVVYDMAQHKPAQAIYDFHHNIRVKDFDYLKEHGYTDGFHPKVYCDAGGHRSLWAVGRKDTKMISIFNVIDVNVYHHSIDPVFDLMAFYLSGYKNQQFRATVGAGYLENSIDMKGLISNMGSVFPPPIDCIADWRNEYACFVSGGPTLNVEDFNQWVYVYNVGTPPSPNIDGLNQEVETVYFTETHKADDLMTVSDDSVITSISGKYLWPSSFKVDDERFSTYLPWTVSAGTGDDYGYGFNTVPGAWDSSSATTLDAWSNKMVAYVAQMLGD